MKQPVAYGARNLSAFGVKTVQRTWAANDDRRKKSTSTAFIPADCQMNRARGQSLAILSLFATAGLPVLLLLLRLKIFKFRDVFGTTDADPHAITPADAMTALSRLCMLDYQIDDKTPVTRLPKPDARQKQILEALQVHLPQK